MENPNSQIVIYKDRNGHIKIDVRFEDETVWLTQNSLAELFQTKDVIKILKNREVYRHLSNAADRIVTAASIIGDIVVKYT